MNEFAKNLKEYCMTKNCEKCPFTDYYVVDDKDIDDPIYEVDGYYCPVAHMVYNLGEKLEYVQNPEERDVSEDLLKSIIEGLKKECNCEECESCHPFPLEFVVEKKGWCSEYDVVSKCVVPIALKIFEDELEYYGY